MILTKTTNIRTGSQSDEFISVTIAIGTWIVTLRSLRQRYVCVLLWKKNKAHVANVRKQTQMYMHDATQMVRVGRFNSVLAYVCPVWTQTG
ncbi:MAG: hypothetical protein OXI43_10100 [Candidatus Poribacteria bacterium]|nr:hypothetical protein [Candidatus Poribacteria bacterium]